MKNLLLEVWCSSYGLGLIIWHHWYMVVGPLVFIQMIREGKDAK